MKSKNRSPNGSVLSWRLPLVISLSYVYLSVQRDLGLSIPVLIGTTAVVVISLAVLLYAGDREPLDLSPGVILVFALFFRLLFVFRVPELSDDIYRYLWDGLQTLRGVNPYSFAPDIAKAGEVNGFALLQKINHPDLVTIYPPVSQLVFTIGAAISHSLMGMKILLVTLDIATCVIMLKLLDTLGLPAWRGTLYAWHPLPIIEIAGSGHIDGVSIFFLITGFILLFNSRKALCPGPPCRRGYSVAAGAVFGASVLIKFIPLIYLPYLLLLNRSKRAMMLLGLSAAVILFSVPFIPDLHHMIFTLGTYLRHWEFSNFLFRALRDLTSSGDNARLVLGFLFAACLLVLVILFAARQKGSDSRQAFRLLLGTLYGVTFAFLLLSPTLHPWYALYLVAFFPFVVGPAGLVLGWAVFLSYYVLIDYVLTGHWLENNLIASALWVSPLIASLSSWVAGRVAPQQDTPALPGSPHNGLRISEHESRRN